MDNICDNPKCAVLLETGRRLFWKHGFRRVSVEEVCLEAGVSKMTSYRFFRNKTDLARKIYRQVVDEGIEKFRDIMSADTSPTEKLNRILLLKLESTNEISLEFIMDFYNSREPGMKEFVEKVTSEAWSGITDSFREAQEKGIFRKDFRPEFLLHLTQYLTPMFTDEKLLKIYDKPQELVMEVAKFFTWGIAPHNDDK